MTSFAMRHKILVVCCWMLFTVCGGRFVGTMMHRMDYTYTTPGQPGYIANQHILDSFGIDATFEPFLAELHLPKRKGMDTPDGQALASRTFNSAERRA
jgi:RND superfamily putative drug exporter